MFGVVYGIECMLDHKIYIGQITNPVEKRVLQHKRAKTVIGRAIRENGWENFIYVVLAECNSFEELNECEKTLIKKLNCMVPNGYNVQSGGRNCVRHTRYTEPKIIFRKEPIKYDLPVYTHDSLFFQ